MQADKSFSPLEYLAVQAERGIGQEKVRVASCGRHCMTYC
jgi:hypothetical protein